MENIGNIMAPAASAGPKPRTMKLLILQLRIFIATTTTLPRVIGSKLDKLLSTKQK